jgi:hypothetical protein
MTEFIPTEKGTPIRYPSVANLMIDSDDRSLVKYPSPWNFQITRNSALLNGYFTRVAATEVVLDWFEPNIVTGVNDTFTVVKTSGAVPYTVTLPYGTYTVAQALDALVVQLNAAGTGLTWSISGTGPTTALAATGAFTITLTALSADLSFDPTSPSATVQYVQGPDLRPFPYIDILSDELTYNQDVKDATSTTYDTNVLCRWYFSNDEANQLDKYGFPILMGYTDFSVRRLFNPAKQIKWQPNQPIGNLGFRVVYQNTTLPNAFSSVSSGFKMTLQVSEV